MYPAAEERRELLRERRLLRHLVALARRCDGLMPASLLDAVLGESCVGRLPPSRRRSRLAGH